jgi:NHLM bacteriocin system ABC transporter peptidase/ATP-binding protein
MEALECGAACLAMVLAHHGRRVPLEELRTACGVSRDGSKASNVLKAARRYGLAGNGYRREVETLGDLPLPAIIHWNFNHFVVLEGFGRRHAILNDPAEGRRAVPLDEFSESFTGVVLAFERAPGFRPGGRAPGLRAALARHMRHSGAALAFLALASIALFVPGVLVPAFARIFVDDVLIGQLRDWLAPLLIGMAVTALLRGALVWLQQRCLVRLEAKLAISMGAKLLWRLLRLPPAFFGQRYAGDVANRVGASDRVAAVLSGQVATNLLSVTALLFYAAVMASYDATLTAIGIGIAGLNVVALAVLARRRGELNRAFLVEQSKLLGAAVDTIRSIESVKAGGLEGSAFSRWAGYQAKMLGVQQRLALADGIANLLPTLLAALTTAAVLGVGGLRVMTGELTVGMLVAFQSLVASFTAPIGGLVEFAGSLQRIKADLARADDVLEHPLEARHGNPGGAAAARMAAGLPDPARLSGAIDIEDVSFGFNPLEPPLIENFSLSLRPGMRVAIVGATGSGKSTVGRIICGLYRPWSGAVRFDGRPVDEIPPSLLAASVAYVDQDIFLFEGTVRQNLTLWDATVPEEALALALKDAAIHEEVATRRGRYDCAVSEGGANFSGGQRQRLEIARALVGDPSVLVLDEATASLDPVTERRIDDSIRRRGCTAIIIAHRLSTIRDCDEIIVLERGKVVARGTHDALLAERGGAYARLIGAG